MTLDKEQFRDEISKAMKEALAGISSDVRIDDKVKTLLESADSTISDLLQTVEAKDAELSKFKDRPQDNALTLLARAGVIMTALDAGQQGAREVGKRWVEDYLDFLRRQKD